MTSINNRTRVDLHIHSYASDGTWPSEEVVKYAKNNNVGLMAITDHDEVKGIKAGEDCAKENHIGFIRGIEISSTLNNELFHILAYGVDIRNSNLISLVENNSMLLDKKDDNTIKYLIDQGYAINFQEYLKYKHDPIRGGWKALSFLIDKKLCNDVGDYFERLFKGKHEIQFPDFSHPEKVIKTIKDAGGVPVLAHPYYAPMDIAVEDRLGIFKEMGIQGFECFHPNHSKEITRLCLEWCKRNDTIITAGSDCHGDFIKSRTIGKPEVYVDDINLGKLKDYIL